ncbi:permease-like cell division protein FtsX [Actinomadura decatromicini]|uniref:FtsX extracellular domain-containing protein n=1 Tax=Actinomadura decatromicini TaxID=2604572 RepID=A0A5D3FQK8_9ACTN|nr:permease-like cell division protein FtsX [Actinomadura decatromicini]TYK51097.1 hypothetical protein FXF68_11660 [Actinomadura decatromicini]
MTEPREDGPDAPGRRSPRPLVLVALFTAFVLSVVGMTAGTYLVFDRTMGKDDAKGGAGRQVNVFLCVKSSDPAKCGQGAATDLQKDAIRKRLQSMPKVRSVVYLSQDQAWADFKRKFADDKDLIGSVRPQDIPDSFQARVEDGGAAKAVKAAMTGVPGVEAVVLDRPA